MLCQRFFPHHLFPQGQSSLEMKMFISSAEGSGLTTSPGTGPPGLVLGMWPKASLKDPALS